MADPLIEIEVSLPVSVEQTLRRICERHKLQPPNAVSIRALSSMDEQSALRIVSKIESSSKPIRTLDGFIRHLINNPPSPIPGISFSTPKKEIDIAAPASLKCPFPSPILNYYHSAPGDFGYNDPTAKKHCLSGCSGSKGASSVNAAQQLSGSLPPKRLDFNSPERASTNQIPGQRILLAEELSFRKFFLIQSYLGREKLEDVISDADAISITNQKNISMVKFESNIWLLFGQRYVCETDRVKYLDWDSGRTHLYHCYVTADGSYTFKGESETQTMVIGCYRFNCSKCIKGPYLSTTKMHLQRALGDENVLIVKFAEDGIDSMNSGISSSNHSAAYSKIAEGGIQVGLWCYRFFVFKDGGKEDKKRSEDEKNKKRPASWAFKCYFVRMESIAHWKVKSYVLSQKTVHEARCLFMHAHMVSSMAKYKSRLSLILSQTIKLPVDLTSVRIERIEDVPCLNENGTVVCDKDGNPLIHTDGTGYISEDLALVCPKEFCNAKYMRDEHLQWSFDDTKLSEQRGVEARTKEPPLLMQCRLFHNGRAFKGTFLVNRKLPSRTIQFRPSMLKVENDSRLSITGSFNSLEVVSVSNKPRQACLSKNLIALLSIGDVPNTYFLDLLKNALEDTHSVYTDGRLAVRALLNHGERDDFFIAAKMIASGIQLDEPYLQYNLSNLAIEERKGLRRGKLPVSESFYLMGTADPTGELKRNQVCIILDIGQLTGKVLVYRNPGLHFGDIHVLEAVYVKALEDVVGNSKYGIFFSTRGQSNVASEIANGDFDGDMYWVCKNTKLLEYYKPTEPWKRMYPKPSGSSKNPSQIPPEELDRELFQLLLDSNNQSGVAGTAADSWQAFVDRFMVLREADMQQKNCLRQKILKLIDIYYDALDAVKTGKKVEVPPGLRADKYPHYMERGESSEFRSTSILGQIYDTVVEFQSFRIEITKLPCFNIQVPDACLKKWKERYDSYKDEMTKALKSGEGSKGSANDVIKKYKQLLYEAPELEESWRDIEDIYNDALAIYHVTYDYAKKTDAQKCGFAWRVAGSALCKFHRLCQNEKPIAILPSVLREMLEHRPKKNKSIA